jgi:hypothetical protein
MDAMARGRRKLNEGPRTGPGDSRRNDLDRRQAASAVASDYFTTRNSGTWDAA